MATFEEAFNEYKNSGQGAALAGVYDAQTQAELGSLKSAYDQNLSTQQAAREKIGGAYQAAGNQMQAQYERNRRNLNQQAAANGINTGAGSQQQLALQNVWNRDYGTLQGQQAQAYADADRAIANLQVTYQNAIQQAQAQGDYRKMAALLDDYNQQYNRQMQQAQLLASYGDFSGYNNLYSEEQITNMRNSWIAQNPLLAYNTGAITADQYKAMTGQYAPGQESKSAGSGSNPGGTPSFLERALALAQQGATFAQIASALYSEQAQGNVSEEDVSKIKTAVGKFLNPNPASPPKAGSRDANAPNYIGTPNYSISPNATGYYNPARPNG